MIDLLIVCLISWLAFAGYRLGGTASLIQLSGIVGMIFITEQTSPWIRLLGYDPGLSDAVTRWLARILSPTIPLWKHILDGVVPVTAHAQAPAIDGVARAIYIDASTGGYALAVYFGLQMALRSLETLWPYGGLKRRRPMAGAWLGAAVGFFASIRLMQTLSLWIYMNHVHAGELALYQSVWVHTWTGWISHGIVD